MISIHNGKAVFFSAIAVASAMFMPLADAQTPMAASMPMAGGMDMKTMMKDNNDKMSSMTMTGNADVDFAMMMRIHHQGAIDMAQAELKNGKEPQMRKMAQNIIATQKKEIAQFDRFLAKHGHPADKMSK
ncbi:DUF305 domain-containing protein [Polaromonas aquatica]|uniref:DUF305 domain-containing protein n=1 Tax=Polaromonas aquatica TaxID=332657 RepID=A0ABW1TWU2_9BURK